MTKPLHFRFHLSKRKAYRVAQIDPLVGLGLHEFTIDEQRHLFLHQQKSAEHASNVSVSFHRFPPPFSLERQTHRGRSERARMVAQRRLALGDGRRSVAKHEDARGGGKCALTLEAKRIADCEGEMERRRATHSCVRTSTRDAVHSGRFRRRTVSCRPHLLEVEMESQLHLS